ncbi:MotA/TolQ/ExbB proton channel family protein [candidate division KSB1 bacterium]|nr:MAG: MotA/TolQ/ExbB proton channel family protein [candidate division KSB1 bacterium]
MWEEIAKGGIMMVPLFICSILALAITLERAFTLRRKKIVQGEIVQIIESIKNPADIDKARSMCKKIPGSFSAIISTGLQNLNLNREDLKEVIEEKGKQEVRVLERGLVVLETIAGIAPLLGLLGTVLGMIRVFKSISIEGIGRTTSLSTGIYEALYTTVAGLTIGIFSQIFYNFFTNKADDIISEIEKYSSMFINKIKIP